VVVESSKSLFTDIFTELITQAKSLDLANQISDLNIQLIEERSHLQDVNEVQHQNKIINDQIAETTAKINQLHKEQAMIYVNYLLNALTKIWEKMQDMITSKLVQSIFEAVSPKESKSVAEEMKSSAQAMVELDLLDKWIAEQRLLIEQKISALKRGGGNIPEGYMPFGLPINEIFSWMSSLGGLSGGGLPGTEVLPTTSGAPQFGATTPTYTPTESQLSRPITTVNHVTQIDASVKFLGAVYGAQDFDKRVDQAVKKIQRNLA
jgi:hypothetical protein